MDEKNVRTSEKPTESLTDEFNHLINQISTDIIHSTALQSLEKTNSTLNSKIPKLEKVREDLDVEMGRLKQTNNDLDHLKLNQTAERVEKTYEMINANSQTIEAMKKELDDSQKAQEELIKRVSTLELNLQTYLDDSKTVNGTANRIQKRIINDALIEFESKLNKKFYIIIAAIVILALIL